MVFDYLIYKAIDLAAEWCIVVLFKGICAFVKFSIASVSKLCSIVVLYCSYCCKRGDPSAVQGRRSTEPIGLLPSNRSGTAVRNSGLAVELVNPKAKGLDTRRIVRNTQYGRSGRSRSGSTASSSSG